MARITEKLRIKVKQCNTVKNPFYVMWFNEYGGLDYWLFEKEQVIGIEVGDVVTYTPNISDISTANTAKSQLSRSSTPYTICEAYGLTEDEAIGLMGLKESTKVYWLKDKDNNIWQEVFPASGSYEYLNKQQGYRFRIRFNKNKKFLPTN